MAEVGAAGAQRRADGGGTVSGRPRAVPVGARVVALLALLGVSVLVLANSRDELLSAATQIRGVAPWWGLLALVLEVVSYTEYAAAQRLLLRCAGGPEVGLATLTTTAVVAQATANCIPGGLAVTTVVSYRQFGRRGVRPALTGWVLVLSSGLFLAALALLSLVAVQIVGAQSPVPGLRATSLGLVLALLVLAGTLVVLRDRVDLPRLERSARARLTRWRRRLPGGVPRPAGAQLWTAQLASFRAGPGVLAACLLCMVLSWVADLGVLVTAFQALGTPVPWRGLLLAYCAGQVAAAVPVTPGGLGVVEGSLTLALVSFGGAEQTTLAAVLFYRLVSFWALLPAGAAGWALLRRAGRPGSPPVEGMERPAPLATREGRA